MDHARIWGRRRVVSVPLNEDGIIALRPEVLEMQIGKRIVVRRYCAEGCPGQMHRTYVAKLNKSVCIEGYRLPGSRSLKLVYLVQETNPWQYRKSQTQ